MLTKPGYRQKHLDNQRISECRVRGMLDALATPMLWSSSNGPS